MVLRDAHNYFITFVKHQIPKAVCSKVQALRCISRKNNFIRSCCIDEFLHLFPCLLVFFCCRLRKVIQPAQRICIAFFVKLRHRPDHLTGEQILKAMSTKDDFKAELIAISENGKMYTFKVEAYDNKGLIGEGTHERAIIDCERFMNKCLAKLED